MPIRRDESLSLKYPFRIPFSMSTVSCVGSPSSSTLSDPRRQGMVPLSTTVHFSLATRLPTSPANADVFLRLKSASSPCPTASCKSTPGHPGPSTTSISPAGASRASSCSSACRAASFAKYSGFLSPKKESSNFGFRGSAGDQCRRARRVQNTIRGKVVRVGISRALSRDHAYSASRRNALRGGLHHRFVHHQRRRGEIFEVEVGVIAPRRN